MLDSMDFKYVIGEISFNNYYDTWLNNRGADHVNVETKYLNYTDQDVVVITRDGFRNVVKAISNHPTFKDFIIITTYITEHGNNSEVMLEFLDSYKSHPEDFGYVDVMKTAAYNQPNVRKKFMNDAPLVGFLNFDVSVVVKREDLIEKDVYVGVKDLLLTTKPITEHVYHPFSSTSLIQENYNEVCKEYEGIAAFMELVDNENTIGKRFVYAFKRIWEIHPVKRQHRKSGIYCGKIQKVNGKTVKSEVEYFTLEEAEEQFGVYSNKEDAISGGDPKLVMQEEVQRLTAENNRITFESKNAIELLKRESAEREALAKSKLLLAEQALAEAKRKFDLEKNELESNRIRENAHYEQKSIGRKNTNEFLKFITGAIAAGFALFAALWKRK